MATIFVFLYMGVDWRQLANTTEPPVCGGDAALCQITLTTCYYPHLLQTVVHRTVKAKNITKILKKP